MGNTIWLIGGILSVILLAIYFRTRNAVWSGLTTGIIIGLVVALFSDSDWYIIGKGAVLGTIIGFGAELLGKISDKMRNRK